MRAGLILAVALAVSGCGLSEKAFDYFGGRPSFDGQTYRARLDADKDDKAQFVVTVDGVSKSLTGAREAGRYEVVQYCIKQYGNSAADWINGPDDDDAALVIADDTLTLRGRCKGW